MYSKGMRGCTQQADSSWAGRQEQATAHPPMCSALSPNAPPLHLSQLLPSKGCMPLPYPPHPHPPPTHTTVH